MTVRFLAIKASSHFTELDFAEGAVEVDDGVRFEIPIFSENSYFAIAVESGFIFRKIILDTGYNQDMTDQFSDPVGMSLSFASYSLYVSKLPYYQSLSGHDVVLYE